MVYRKSGAGIFKIWIFSRDNTSLVVKLSYFRRFSPQAMYYLGMYLSGFKDVERNDQF